MKIDKKLNLIIPISDGTIQTEIDGKLVEQENIIAWVHSTPISKETFERYYLVISKTFSLIHSQGLNAITGPRVAALALKEVANSLPPKDDGAETFWDGPSGVQVGLMAEIGRLTNVFIFGQGEGWIQVPFSEAKSKGYLTGDDCSEVENALVFFTVASSMYPKKHLDSILKVSTGIWGGQVSLLGCMEFKNSLPTSTTAGSIGVKTVGDLSVIA